jgi:hypothetical protein
MISILKEKIADVSAGKIGGIAIICEYQDQYTLDMPGEFAGDVGFNIGTCWAASDSQPVHVLNGN